MPAEGQICTVIRDLPWLLPLFLSLLSGSWKCGAHLGMLLAHPGLSLSTLTSSWDLPVFCPRPLLAPLLTVHMQ